MNKFLILATALLVWGPPRMRLTPRPLDAVFSDPSAMDLIALLQVAFPFVAALAVAGAAAQRGLEKPPLPALVRKKVLLPYLVFFVFALLSATYSVYPLYTFFYAAKALIALIAVAMLAGEAFSISSGYKILRIYYGVILFQWFLIIILFFIDPYLVGTDIKGVGYRLHAALFGDYGASAALLGFLFLLCFLHTRLLRNKVFWIALYMISVYFVFLSRTRSMFGAAVAGLSILIWLNMNGWKRIAVVTVLLATFCAVYSLGLDETIIAYVMRGQNTAAFLSLTGRTYAFEHLLAAWREAPVFGHGFAAGSRYYLMSFVYDYGLGIGAAHDALSKVLVELGLAGAGLLLLSVVCVSIRVVLAVRRAKSYGDSYRLAQHSAILLMYSLVSSVVGSGVADVCFPFIICAACAEIVLRHIKREELLSTIAEKYRFVHVAKSYACI